jgi:predicted AlkP superfamily phosphohydrolase/phosphomutase
METDSMKRPVIAIGLDAMNPELLQQWMETGHLKNLAAIRARGGFGYLNNVSIDRTETSWITF